MKMLVDLCKTDDEAAAVISDRGEEGFDLVWSDRPDVVRTVVHDHGGTIVGGAGNRIILIFKQRAKNTPAP